jgi:hypothetical protein
VQQGGLPQGLVSQILLHLISLPRRNYVSKQVRESAQHTCQGETTMEAFRPNNPPCKGQASSSSSSACAELLILSVSLNGHRSVASYIHSVEIKNMMKIDIYILKNRKQNNRFKTQPWVISSRSYIRKKKKDQIDYS